MSNATGNPTPAPRPPPAGGGGGKPRRGKPKPAHVGGYEASATEETPPSPAHVLCPVCKSSKPHKNLKGYTTKSLQSCPKFRALPVPERQKMVKGLKYCHMCLGPDCAPDKCRIKGLCFTCQKHRHHKFVCSARKEAPVTPAPRPDSKDKDGVVPIEANAVTNPKPASILLVGYVDIDAASGVSRQLVHWDQGAADNFTVTGIAQPQGLCIDIE